MITNSYWERKLKIAADHNSQIPPEFVWQNIEKELHPKKKQKALIWFLISSFILAGLAYIIVSQNNKPPFENGQSFAIGNEKTKSTTSGMEEILVSNSDFEGSVQKGSTTNHPESHRSLSEAKLQLNKLYTTSPVNNPSSLSNQNIPSKYPVTSITKLNEEALLEMPFSKNRENVYSNHLPLRSALELNSDQSKFKLQNKIECPDFSRKSKLVVFAEGNLIGGFHKRTFSVLNAESNNLLNLREQTESPWYNWGLGFLGGVYITRNFYIGAGLTYSQVKDRFSHSVTGITKVIIDFDPVTGIPTDTTIVTGTLVTKGEVRYSTFDFPVVVGYEKNYDTWGIGLEGGIVFNLSMASQGRIFDNNLKISPIQNQGDIFKKNLGLGAAFSVVLKRNLTNDLSIHLKPGIRMYLKDWNSVSYPIKSDYQLFSVSVGVRKLF